MKFKITLVMILFALLCLSLIGCSNNPDSAAHKETRQTHLQRACELINNVENMPSSIEQESSASVANDAYYASATDDAFPAESSYTITKKHLDKYYVNNEVPDLLTRCADNFGFDPLGASLTWLLETRDFLLENVKQLDTWISVANNTKERISYRVSYDLNKDIATAEQIQHNDHNDGTGYYTDYIMLKSTYTDDGNIYIHLSHETYNSDYDGKKISYCYENIEYLENIRYRFSFYDADISSGTACCDILEQDYLTNRVFIERKVSTYPERTPLYEDYKSQNLFWENEKYCYSSEGTNHSNVQNKNHKIIFKEENNVSGADYYLYLNMGFISGWDSFTCYPGQNPYPDGLTPCSLVINGTTYTDNCGPFQISWIKQFGGELGSYYVPYLIAYNAYENFDSVLQSLAELGLSLTDIDIMEEHKNCEKEIASHKAFNGRITNNLTFDDIIDIETGLRLFPHKTEEEILQMFELPSILPQDQVEDNRFITIMDLSVESSNISFDDGTISCNELTANLRKNAFLKKDTYNLMLSFRGMYNSIDYKLASATFDGVDGLTFSSDMSFNLDYSLLNCGEYNIVLYVMDNEQNRVSTYVMVPFSGSFDEYFSFGNKVGNFIPYDNEFAKLVVLNSD